MALSSGDQNVVDNTRHRLKEKVAKYSDGHIAAVWRQFSFTEEYPDDEWFLKMLEEML